MKGKTILRVGIDDTDSSKGMCTTYLAYKIVNSLKQENVEFLDLPRLVRFNPNIPWKTRGNGAVGLKILTSNPEKIKKLIRNFVIKFSDIKNGANPGLVFYDNDKIHQNFLEFSELALWKLISRNEAIKFSLSHKLDTFHLGNGQGLVGAIAVIGYQFNDHTLELLSYRKKSNFGTKRKLSSQSVEKMQEKTYPDTFNSYDKKKKKILISPRSPDPVFYGIRGEHIPSLLNASKIIETNEKLDGYMIFKTNQGTSDHLKNYIDIKNIKPYLSGKIIGYVNKKPLTEKGGHVFFSIINNGDEIKCGVYKPTGLRNTIIHLIKGDKIMVGGGIRKSSKNHPQILNVEFLKVIKLERNKILTNPTCQNCNKKMKSKGANQGYECIKCGKRSNRLVSQFIPRQIKQQFYLPTLTAHRHLTRPIQRIGKINKEKQYTDSNKWFFTFKN